MMRKTTCLEAKFVWIGLGLSVLCLSCGMLAGETGSSAGKTEVYMTAGKENPLSFSGGRLVLDVEERLRAEWRNNNFDFNSGVDTITDDTFLLQRFRLGAKVRVSDWLTVYGQAQSAYEFSDRPDDPGVFAAEGDDPVDLQQAWLELGNMDEFPLMAKIGRQVFNYGDQRLVGGFDWNNLGRVFDAARLRYQSSGFWVEGFAGSVVIPRRTHFNRSDVFGGNDTGRDQVFSGVYASSDSLLAGHTLEAYAFLLNQANGNVANSAPLLRAAPAGASGGDKMKRSDYITLGSRIARKPAAGAIDYGVEAAFQTGKVAGLDLTAFAAHANAGYTLDTAWQPRLGIEYNYGSGDSNVTDSKITTFQNLFPTNHKFYGAMDLFSWQNMHNVALLVSVKPSEKLSVSAAFHLFWLATTNDAWYRANGITRVRPASPGASSYVGSELDLTVSYKAASWLAFQAGYSHFFTGSYVEDTGPASDADFVFFQAELKF